MTGNTRTEASQEFPAQLDRDVLRLPERDEKPGELSMSSDKHKLVPLDQLRGSAPKLPHAGDAHTCSAR